MAVAVAFVPFVICAPIRAAIAQTTVTAADINAEEFLWSGCTLAQFLGMTRYARRVFRVARRGAA